MKGWRLRTLIVLDMLKIRKNVKPSLGFVYVFYWSWQQ